MDGPEYNFAGDEQDREAKSSGAILGAIAKAQKEFNNWQANCDTIDEVYSQTIGSGLNGILNDGYSWNDTRLDLFWASYEVLKPATYARTPVPAVAARFKDNLPLYNVTGELLERCTVQVFDQNCIHDAMCHSRDDLLFAARGTLWVSLIGEDVEVDHVDRTDFLHEPARYWREVGWAAKRSWLTFDENVKRFGREKAEMMAYDTQKREGPNGTNEVEGSAPKAGVWEVWHKADNKVYWVSEGCSVILDEGKPHLNLSGFFPCPQPAFGTLQRRTLIPIPDWNRYAIHFRKISELTGRIYTLLDSVKMMGLIPGGGDVGQAIKRILASDDDQILIEVPSAALLANGGKMVEWLPLVDVAAAIQGLIDARTQLISDFYQLSGISDIMRGATEAEETLGAQELKSHYGSIRVKEKVTALQNLAAGAARIVAEILAEKFSKTALLEMSGMEIPTKAEVQKQIKELEKAAEEELGQLAEQAQMAAQQPNAQAQFQQAGPEGAQQAEQAFQQAQQQIIQKYAPKLEQLQNTVPIEDVMTLLRDDKARGFTFDIETDSTILSDEMSEKQSRNEFMTQFVNSSQGLQSLMAMGEQGSALAGEMMKFVLAPYRAGRTLEGAIDAFIDAAPEMAAKAAAQAGAGNDELNEANKALAEAENKKADAAMASVQARAQAAEADNQRKMAEMQAKMMNEQQKAQEAMAKLQLQLQKQDADAAEQQAKIDHLTAQTAEILNRIGLDVRAQQLDEYKAANDAQARAVDQAQAAENQAIDTEFRERGEQRADMGEQRADRQQTFTEQQSMNGEG